MSRVLTTWMSLACISVSTAALAATPPQLTCALDAVAKKIPQANAADLCQGATNLAPVECAVKVIEKGFNHAQAARLCVGTTVAAPADCAIEARDKGFFEGDAVTLCTPKP